MPDRWQAIEQRPLAHGGGGAEGRIVLRRGEVRGTAGHRPQTQPLTTLEQLRLMLRIARTHDLQPEPRTEDGVQAFGQGDVVDEQVQSFGIVAQHIRKGARGFGRRRAGWPGLQMQTTQDAAEAAIAAAFGDEGDAARACCRRQAPTSGADVGVRRARRKRWRRRDYWCRSAPGPSSRRRRRGPPAPADSRRFEERIPAVTMQRGRHGRFRERDVPTSKAEDGLNTRSDRRITLPYGVVTGRRTRTSRKPVIQFRAVGKLLTRSAARQNSPPPFQQPPRVVPSPWTTRTTPISRTSLVNCNAPSTESGLWGGRLSSSHHCHTLPCMSYRPSLFGAYEPTLVVRSRYGPFSPFPNGKLPSKFASFEDRSFVGFVEVEVVRTLFLRSGPSPTRIFPFRLTRQAVHPALSLLLLVQLLDELLAVVPRHTLHRELLQILILDVLDLVLAPAVAGEVARVLAHHCLPLTLRHRVDRDLEILLDLRLLREPLRLSSPCRTSPSAGARTSSPAGRPSVFPAQHRRQE